MHTDNTLGQLKETNHSQTCICTQPQMTDVGVSWSISHQKDAFRLVNIQKVDILFFKKKRSNTSSGSSSSSKLPSSSGSSSVERIISMLKTACHDSTAHKINGHHLHISVASWCWVHRVMTKHESCVQYLIEHYLPENVLTCSWATRNQQGDRLRTQEPLNWYSCVLASHMKLLWLHYMSISNSFTITIVVPWDRLGKK